jgi:hypothetical protein
VGDAGREARRAARRHDDRGVVAPVRADPRLVGRIGEIDRVSGRERVVGGNHQVERVVQERLLVEPRVVARWRVRGGQDDGDVGSTREQQREALRVACLRELDLRRVAQRGRGRCDQCGERGRERAQPQRAARRGSGHLGEHAFPVGVEPVGVAEQQPRGRGEPHAAAHPLQQLDADVPAQQPDLLRHRGRREEQRRRGRRDGAVLVEHPQDVQPAQIDHSGQATRKYARNRSWTFTESGRMVGACPAPRCSCSPAWSACRRGRR